MPYETRSIAPSLRAETVRRQFRTEEGAMGSPCNRVASWMMSRGRSG